MSQLTQVLLVGSPSHQQQLRSWAASAGLPSSCIVTISSCTGLLQGLTAAVAAHPSLADNYVLAADAKFVLEPGTSLSRLVEAAAVRSKDTITCTVPFEGADLAQLVQVHKEDPTAANNRVTIQTDAQGLADGYTDSVLGPVAVLSPVSMGSLTHGAAAAAVAGSGMLDLGLFLQLQQQQQGRAVYSVDLPLFFSLDKEDFPLTDAFFRHYKELQRIATREAQQLAVGVECAAAARITGTIDTLMSKLQTLGAGHPPSPVRQQLIAAVNPASSSSSTNGSPAASLSGSGSRFNSSSGSGSGSSLKHMFGEFAAKYQPQLDNAAKAPVTHDYATLPCRRVEAAELHLQPADGLRPNATVCMRVLLSVPQRCWLEHPEAWELRQKKQHPCYTTSSNDYGAKHPTGFDMPLLWTGIHGKFTNTFNGGCYRSMGLKTSVERSRVHRELDYL
uniref:Uncharacterized protein n=1 Tax=Tetradesmus obliquus TaxID=3088 RepID=A0A383WMY4_TETOB|eukprot:jgi/Sobl393_1/15970/SZX78797.1